MQAMKSTFLPRANGILPPSSFASLRKPILVQTMGEIVVLLRHEGIYFSTLTDFRKHKGFGA